MAILAALSLAGSVFLSATANGIAVFMVFGAGLVAGLLGQIGEALSSGTLQDVATRRELAAAVRGALPGRARRADRRHDRLHPASRSTSGRSAARESAGPGLWLWALVYLGLVGAWALRGFARRDL